MKVSVNWKREGLVVWRPVKALLFADKKAFYWIKDKLGLSEVRNGCLGLGERGHRWPAARIFLVLMISMKALLTAVLLLASAAPAALAQKEIPKAEGP